MSILIALIVGVLVGAAIGMILPKGADLLLLNIISGIVGSIIGLATYYFLFTTELATGLFNPVAILCSVIGAALATLTFNSINMLAIRRNDG